MLFSIDLYSAKRNNFILKCSIQFTCTHLDGSQKEGGNFFNLFQKEGGSLRKGGVPTLEETMFKLLHTQIRLQFHHIYLPFLRSHLLNKDWWYCLPIFCILVYWKYMPKKRNPLKVSIVYKQEWYQLLCIQHNFLGFLSLPFLNHLLIFLSIPLF